MKSTAVFLTLLLSAGWASAQEGQDAPQPVEKAAQNAAKKQAKKVKDPADPWFDRQLAFLWRNMSLQADLSIVLREPSEPEPLIINGKLAFAGLRHYELVVSTFSPDPYTGVKSPITVRSLADGTTLWTEENRAGPQGLQVFTRTLDLNYELKATTMGLGRMMPGLDPLDQVFSFDVVRDSFRFESLGQREYEGRQVMVFLGRALAPDKIKGSMKRYYNSGVRTAEVIFDARTGVIVSYELRSPDAIHQTTKLMNLKYPKDLGTGKFVYEPPQGVTVQDQDPDLKRQLDDLRSAPGSN